MLSWVVVFQHAHTGELRPFKVKAVGQQDARESAERNLRFEVETQEAFERWSLHSVNRTEP